MKPEQEPIVAGASAKVAPLPPQYATRAEVEAALNALTATDYAKLTMISISFCQQRHLARSVCEPEDLLNQAVLKTLECEDGKRWNKRVSMVRHLDRAMENISGHLVRERMKIVAFPDGPNPEADQSQVYEPPDATAESAKVVALLNTVFGEDNQAKEIFTLRADGYRPAEIQERLTINATEYETTNRRILRKISQYLTKIEN